MQLHNIIKSKGLVKNSKRLGRGNSSGKWNYCGRWMNWQYSRSWGGMPAWFEWGQTTIVKRMPKLKWFKRSSKFRKEYSVVNVWDIQKDERIKDWAKIDKKFLKDLNYIKSEKENVKVLWSGELSKKVEFIDIDSFSSSAKKKVSESEKK